MPSFSRSRRAAARTDTARFSQVVATPAPVTAPERADLTSGSGDRDSATAAPFAYDFSDVRVHSERAPRVAPAGGPGERRAEAGTPITGSALLRSVLAEGPGRAVDDRIRRSAESTTGTDLSGVRVHDGPDDRRFAHLLGADAATHGQDVFIADGASATDEKLMRHELVHAAESSALVQLRRATFVERRAWLAFFSHYLPRRFLNNYMDDTGTPIVLSAQEMEDCNPIVDIRRSEHFLKEVARIKGRGGGSGAVTVSGWGGALTNGTLGNFTIHYTGRVTVTAGGGWTFAGSMRFHDYWDFDPKSSGSNRSTAGELKVRVANAALPGKPFAIDSVPVPITQADSAARASWGSGRAPQQVGDNAARTGVDIGGGEVAGPVGGEIGAQSSEDLNK